MRYSTCILARRFGGTLEVVETIEVGGEFSSYREWSSAAAGVVAGATTAGARAWGLDTVETSGGIWSRPIKGRGASREAHEGVVVTTKRSERWGARHGSHEAVGAVNS